MIRCLPFLLWVFHAWILPTSVWAQLLDPHLPGEQRFYEPDEGVAVGDRYGAALAMDGAWAVVGAPEDGGQMVASAGAVYVLKRAGETWDVHQKLRPEEPNLSTRAFGSAVALQGALMAVAAPQLADGAVARVLIYRLEGQGWVLEAVVDVPGASGSSMTLALSGNRLILGLPEAGLKGMVQCLEKTDGSWQVMQTLSADESMAEGARFGGAVAIEGDVALVSASGPLQRGLVCEYRRVDGAWVLRRLVENPLPEVGDRFGASLALAAGRALVSAPGGRLSAQTQTRGHAHLYALSPDGWTLLRSLVTGEPSATARPSVALSAARGLMLRENATILEIVVDETRAPSLWTTQVIPSFTMQAENSGFSLAVGLDSGLACSAAPLSSASVGRLVTFAGTATLAVSGQAIPPETRRQPNSGFGEALDLAGDVAAVAAPRFRPSGRHEVGSVTMFQRTQGQWSPVQILDCPSQIEGAQFGRALSLDGDFLAVSAPGLPSATSASGRVYVFQRVAGQWSPQVITVSPPDHLPAGVLGQQLSLSGQRLAISFGPSDRHQNRVLIYQLSTTVATLEREYVGSLSDAFTEHPGSLSLHGNEVAHTLSGAAPAVDVLVRSLTAPVNAAAVTLKADAGDDPVRRHYGRRLVLNHDLLAVSGPTESEWPLVYERRAAKWQLAPPVPRPHDIKTGFFALNQGVLMVGGERIASFFQRQGTGWRWMRDLVSRNYDLGSQVALSEDGVMYGKPGTASVAPSVSFLPTANLGLFSGALAPDLVVENGGSLNLGEFLVDTQAEVKLRFVNFGLRDLGLNSFSILHLEDIEFMNVSTGSVAPGGVWDMTLRLRPKRAGQFSGQLRVSTDDTALGTMVVDLNLTAVKGRSAPLFEAGSPRLLRVGRRLLLQPLVSATRPFACRWLKNGVAMPGQTEPQLYFDSLLPTHAGRYRLELTWPGGRELSPEILVGVFEESVGTLFVGRDRPLSLTARVWGPGIQVAWNVPENWAIRGTRTPTLSISRADILDSIGMGSTAITATARLGETEALAVVKTVQLISAPVLFVGPRPQVLRLGVLHPETSIVDEHGSELLDVTVSGLPAGLTYDAATQRIAGTPTQSGRSVVRIQARNRFGLSAPVEWMVEVVTEETASFGQVRSFAGQIAVPGQPPSTVPRACLITVRIDPAGGLTGQITLGTVRRALATTLQVTSNPESRSAVMELGRWAGFQAVKLEIRQLATLLESPAPTSAILSLLAADGQTMDPPPFDLHPLFIASASERAALLARHAVLLSASTQAESHLPQGSGFFSLTVSSALQANAVGSLPDGLGITFSSPLVRMEGAASFFANHANASGSLLGTLSWDPTDPNFPQPVTLSGTLNWTRPAVSGGRFYAAGFDNLPLQAEGQRYFVPSAGLLLIPGSTDLGGSVQVDLRDGSEVEDLRESATLTAAHQVRFPLPNRHRLSLSIYAPTGFFTGSFVREDLLTDGSGRRVQRLASFRGMIVPGLDRGEGTFLIPALPDAAATPPITSANAPTLSGQVSLRARDFDP